MRRPRTLAGRLFVWQLSVILLVVGGVGFLMDRILEREAVDEITASLERQAHTVREALPDDDADLQPEVLALGSVSEIRITVIRIDGVVLADSENNPATMENDLDRPEVQQALAGSVGTSSQASGTAGAFRYVALPPTRDRIVRVGLPLTQVTERTDSVRETVLLGMFEAAILASLGALLVGRAVTKPLRRAKESAARLAEGDLSVRVDPAGPHEFTALADTLNLMAERLQARAAADEERRTTEER